MDLKLVSQAPEIEEGEQTKVEVALVKNNKPTLVGVAAVALELACYATVATIAFRIGRRVVRR